MRSVTRSCKMTRYGRSIKEMFVSTISISIQIFTRQEVVGEIDEAVVMVMVVKQ